MDFRIEQLVQDEDNFMAEFEVLGLNGQGFLVLEVGEDCGEFCG